MEYYKGIYLSEMIEENHTLSVNKTLEMFLSFIKSMILLQSYGIVNTNVTPFNIWITGNSTLKLIDFIDIQFSLSTAHRSIFLPWEYYPDEILNPKGKLGLYTDVFSLAVTMYCLKINGVIPPSILTPNDSGGMEYFKTERQKRGELGRKTSG